MDSTSNEALDDTSQAHSLHVFIISDSVGDTASALVSAALSQFSGEEACIDRLSKVTDLVQVQNFVDARTDRDLPEIAFITLASPSLSQDVCQYVESLGIASVDLLSPAVTAIAKATGKSPALRAGVNRELDDSYYRRIEAMDYSVDHDDGRLPEEYKYADIVLMGVSRTSKTPLSMYLASRGYKVANLPLAPGVEPPKEIYEIENWRIFGLMSTPDVLSDFREKRLGSDGMQVAGVYASVDYIEQDLEEARTFMRKIGCIVIHTNNRAIEETAQEILRYYETALKSHGG